MYGPITRASKSFDGLTFSKRAHSAYVSASFYASARYLRLHTYARSHNMRDMKRIPKGSPRPTSGAKLLSAWIAEHRSQQQLASLISERLGRHIYQSSVSCWARGLHLPSLPAATAMQELCSIPISAWSVHKGARS
jgi:hypothetical protein